MFGEEESKKGGKFQIKKGGKGKLIFKLNFLNGTHLNKEAPSKWSFNDISGKISENKDIEVLFNVEESSKFIFSLTLYVF
jgi:hypothetical protein